MSGWTRVVRRALAGVVTGGVLFGAASLPAAADHEFSHLEPIGIDTFCQAVPENAAPFTDISTTLFRSEVECLFVSTITIGDRSGNIYRPHDPVPRDQMATFVSRMIGVADDLERPGRDLQGLDPANCGTGPFVDITGMVHTCNINMLAAEGIVVGGVGGRPAEWYSPGLLVTRAQMATYVKRAVEHLLQEEVGTEFEYFHDDDGDVHEPAINYVGESRIAVGNGRGAYGPDRPVTRGQMAAYLARTLAVLVERGHIAPLAP